MLKLLCLYSVFFPIFLLKNDIITRSPSHRYQELLTIKSGAIFLPTLYLDGVWVWQVEDAEDQEAEDKLAAFEAFAGLTIAGLRRRADGNPLGHVTHSQSMDTNPPDGLSPYLSHPRFIGLENCPTVFLSST